MQIHPRLVPVKALATFALLACLGGAPIYAQFADGGSGAQRRPYWELVGHLGIAHYQGDLSKTYLYLNGMRPMLAGALRYAVNPKFAARFNLQGGLLHADDFDSPSRAVRGLRVDIPFASAHVLGEVLPWGQVRMHNGINLSRLKFYLLSGVGVTYASANIENRLSPDLTFPEPGDETIFLDVPVGGGFRYNFTEAFAAHAEGKAHWVFSDYLDGVSENASPAFGDFYYTLSLGVALRVFD